MPDLVVPLGNAFANQLHNPLQLLHRTHDPALDKFQLGCYSRLELLHDVLVLIHMLDGMLCLWMLAQNVVLARERVEYRGEVFGEPSAGGEEVRDAIVECFGVLEQLLRCTFESSKPPVIVIEFRIGRLCAGR